MGTPAPTGLGYRTWVVKTLGHRTWFLKTCVGAHTVRPSFLGRRVSIERAHNVRPYNRFTNISGKHGGICGTGPAI